MGLAILYPIPSTYLRFHICHFPMEMIESFRESLSEPWLRAGVTAMVAFSILIIVSLRPVRSNMYEVFFYVHFLGVLWVHHVYSLVIVIDRRNAVYFWWEDITTPKVLSKCKRIQTAWFLTCSEQQVILDMALVCVLGFRSLHPGGSTSCIQPLLLWVQVRNWDNGRSDRIAFRKCR